MSTPQNEVPALRRTIVNGEEMFNMDDLRFLLTQEIAKLPKEVRPQVLAAQDARATMEELLQGIGGEMEKFREQAKRHLEELRGVKFAYVNEVSAMKKELAELRTFFLGADHDREIVRLREFVDLCERLAKLKESGVLDAVSDTMLKLA